MSDRRRAILDAAQKLFLDKGYASTTISDIREASGASVGSIYHAFGSKEAIAAALVERSVFGWTAATERARRGGAIEDLIRATVEGLLHWSANDPESFQIMDELRSIGERGQAGERLAALLAQGRAESRAVIEAHASRGEIRNLPWRLAQALVLGPSYEYLRSCRGRPPADDLEAIVAHLSDAAWKSLSEVSS